MLKTFSIQTLGCRVNQYESDQLATLLRSRGLQQIESGGDVRVVNSCSVTVHAASKSRQTVRRAIKLPVLASNKSPPDFASETSGDTKPRVIVTGCWATSNPSEAAKLAGVDAVISHHHDVAAELDQLLHAWRENPPSSAINHTHETRASVKEKVRRQTVGTRHLPLLGERQSGHQRAFLKIQDGCDAHCTYCIIPRLRPSLWSKPVDDAVEEANRLVESGHREIVLTGIFLGAYGQPTALRRRQEIASGKPLADLVTALCTRVPGLHRLRFSSLEPGDLTDDLLSAMRSNEAVVPHFHLPLQSGSDLMLHRMNRQYTRDDFLRLIDRVRDSFDRPSLTTDVIVGFPGETNEEFERTMEVVDRAQFIHTHAFSYSPRPGTAAARWTGEFIHGPIVNERIERLNNRARQHSLEYRKQFLNETVEVLVENDDDTISHGRCERYFDVKFNHSAARGDAVRLKITNVDSDETWGEPVQELMVK